MKLFVSPMSPYTRKVRAVAWHLGLYKDMEIVLCKVRVKTNGLESFNPMQRVPTLVTDDGMALYDSPVICEYLDSLHEGPKLLPSTLPERWKVLRYQALGDGVMDAASALREESLRPQEQQSDELKAVYLRMIKDSLVYLEGDTKYYHETSIGTFAIACALGYLDFRHSAFDWRQITPLLGTWFDDFAQCEAMVETQPYQYNPFSEEAKA